MVHICVDIDQRTSAIITTLLLFCVYKQNIDISTWWNAMFFLVYSRGNHTAAGPHRQLASTIIYHIEKYWNQMAPRRNFYGKRSLFWKVAESGASS